MHFKYLNTDTYTRTLNAEQGRILSVCPIETLLYKLSLYKTNLGHVRQKFDFGC